MLDYSLELLDFFKDLTSIDKKKRLDSELVFKNA